jgi:quinol monooxygenase YgiN
MSFIMLARFVPRAGAEDELLSELTAMVAPSLAEPGCLRYQPLLDPARAGTVIMVEEWADRAALEQHFASPHFVRVAPRLAELVGEPVAVDELLPSPDNPRSLIGAQELRALAG